MPVLGSLNDNKNGFEFLEAIRQGESVHREYSCLKWRTIDAKLSHRPQTIEEPEMIFGYNTTKLTLRELLFEQSLLVYPLIFMLFVLSRLFRFQLPGSSDIPPTETLDEYYCDREAISDDLRLALAATDHELRDLGFADCTAISIHDKNSQTRYGSLVYLSPDHKTIAWIRTRRQPILPANKQYVRVQLISIGRSGQLISTTSSGRDVLDPPDWSIRYFPRVKLAQLLSKHEQHLAERSTATELPRVFENVDVAADALAASHGRWIAFQRTRGFLVEPKRFPGSEFEGGHDDPIVAAVRVMENKKTQWITKLAILVFSIVAFVALGLFQFTWEWMLMILPVLFVHELGHLIAMKIFGYKNVQMFYIPFFGAAVTGRHYNVEGWKKAIVSLAGPVPSIVIGVLISIVAILTQWGWAEKLALITLMINGFNLLPFLPLDGGWVAHTTLFSRSRYLDMGYRIFAVLMTFLVVLLLQTRGMIVVAIGMVIALPAAWKTMLVVDQLRNQPLPEATDNRIPTGAIQQISKMLQDAKLPAANIKQLASVTVQVYEQLSAKPPSALASVGLLFTQFASMVLVLLCCLGMFGAKVYRNFAKLRDLERETVLVALDTSKPRIAVGTTPLPQRDLLFWEFQDAETADQAFDQKKSQGSFSAVQFGAMIIQSSPSKNELEVGEKEIDIEQLIWPLEAERLSVEDPRLADIAASPRKSRCFLDELPKVKVRFKDQQSAKKAIDEINITPQMRFADSMPVPAWYPPNGKYEERRKLRQLLSVLQENREIAPWNEPDPSRDKAGQKNVKIEEIEKDWAKDRKERSLRKAAWMESQMVTTTGESLGLLKAYQKYEAELQSFIEKSELQNATSSDDDEFEKYPKLEDYLSQFKDSLGYLDSNEKNFRLAAYASTHFASTFADDASVTTFLPDEPESDLDSAVAEKIPQAEAETAIQIYLYDSPDPAVAIGGLIAWLKKNGAEEISLAYTVVKKRTP